MSHLLTTKKTEALDAAVAEASRNQRSTRPREDAVETPQERLWNAAEQGKLEVLRATCSERVDLDARRPADGLAALHLACIRGSDGAVATLLREGAAVTAVDASGRTALHAAAASDRSRRAEASNAVNSAADTAPATVSARRLSDARAFSSVKQRIR